jgi:RNA polymerase sigma-70 factor (ECF subfamily)
MTKRLMRAKAKIRGAGIPFRVPPIHLLPERLDTLLTVIYLIFTEGYHATRGAELIRRDLCTEAIRLTRNLLKLLPEDVEWTEVSGLLALLLLHDSRRNARIGPSGELVLLEDQDRSEWDQAQIREGLAVLEGALAMGKPGPYQVQAAISALHVQAATPQDTDWEQIKTLYDILAGMVPTSVVQVNRAVAIGMADGSQAGLEALKAIEYAENYFPFHAAQADLLRRSKDYQAAAAAYQRAIALCQNEMEHSYLSRRLAEMLGDHQ